MAFKVWLNDFAIEQPVDGASQRGVSGRQSRVTKRDGGDGGVPDRRMARLQSIGSVFADHEVFELLEGLDQDRGVVGISQALQRHDTPDHGWKDRTQPVTVGKSFDHPVGSPPDGRAAKRGQLPSFDAFPGGIEPGEDPVPVDSAGRCEFVELSTLRHGRRQRGRSMEKQLVDLPFRRSVDSRSVSPQQAQWDKDRP